MFDRFKKYISNKVSLSDEDFLHIQQVSTIKKLRKRQYLLQEGNVWKYNAFVCEGFVRTYFVDDKTQEHIMSFNVSFEVIIRGFVVTQLNKFTAATQ